MALSRDPSALLADILKRTQAEKQTMDTSNEAKLAELIANTSAGSGAKYNLPNMPGALPTALTAWLSNVASAISGNRSYSESNTRQFENTLNNRRQAEGTKAGLDYQSTVERHQQLLQIQGQDLQRRYDAARALGEHAHAVELQDAILKNSNEQARLGRELQKYISDQAKNTAIKVAEINNAPQPKVITGDPNMDRILRAADSRRMINAMAAEAFKDSGAKGKFETWKKQNPVWGQLDAMIGSTLSQEKPYANEPSQQYVSRLGFAGMTPDRIAALAKANYPNEQAISAAPPQPGGGPPFPGTPLGSAIQSGQANLRQLPTALGQLGASPFDVFGLGQGPLLWQYLTTPYSQYPPMGPPAPTSP